MRMYNDYKRNSTITKLLTMTSLINKSNTNQYHHIHILSPYTMDYKPSPCLWINKKKYANHQHYDHCLDSKMANFHNGESACAF